MTAEIRHSKRSFADFAHNAVTAWVVLGLSLCLTALAWQVSSQSVERRAQEIFQYTADEAKLAIAKRMLDYEQTLRSGVALFNASGRQVSREEWRTYVETLDIETYFPGLQGIGFAQWIAPQDRAAVIGQVRAEGYQDFDIKPSGEREHYSSIIYLEPMDARNQRAFGYDMYSESIRRAAMTHARDSGQPSVSGRVVLLQETEWDIQAGFLMYLPVYHSGVPIETVAQRRAALMGFVYSPFRMEDLMDGILGLRTPELDFQIYDSGSVDSDSLLFDTYAAWRKSAAEPVHRAAYSVDRLIELPGRTWTVRFSSRPGFEQGMASSQPQLVAAGGLVVDLLLFAILVSLARQRKRVQVAAAEMTQALRHSHEQYQTITETAHDAILSVDQDGKVLYCNPAACEIFGHGSDQLVGQSITQLLPPSLRSTATSELLRILAADSTTAVQTSLETLGLRYDVIEFPLEVAIASAVVEGRRYFTLMMRDISERKRNTRLKDEFISTVSHELRTPLTAIRGALGMLTGAKAQLPEAQQSQLLCIAHQNTERLANLVNDILDLEKLEAGQMTLNKRAVYLPELLRQALSQNSTCAEPRDIALQLAEPIPDVWLQADPHRLMQVLTNLLSNAIKFSQQGACVILGAALREDTVRISVEDTGVGIPNNFRGHIFDRFTQADSSDTRHRGGSGLGLSICKSIMELHAGSINFTSEPGKGSCFYIDLAVREGCPGDDDDIAVFAYA